MRIQIPNFQKYLILLLKFYLDVCLIFMIVIVLSIIFTHLFHHMLSTGTYLKSIFMIWLFTLPLFLFINSFMILIKKFRRLSSLIFDNRKFTILKVFVITIVTIGLLIIFQLNYIGLYFVPVMGSAKPNLFEGDYLMVDKYWMNNNFPSYGDVIGFKSPKMNFDMIKRCVAFGGDTLEIKDGIVTINDKPEGRLDYMKTVYDPVEKQELEYYKITKMNGFEHFVCYRSDSNFRKQHFGPVIVPEKHCFLLGDHRDNSGDSRYYGAFPIEQMFCKAGLVYFSIDPVTKRIRWSRIGVII